MEHGAQMPTAPAVEAYATADGLAIGDAIFKAHLQIVSFYKEIVNRANSRPRQIIARL
jgi:hypothetical protein